MIPHTATLDILDRLIAFPTVSAQSNLALIDYAEDLLSNAGFATQRIPDPDGQKSGLAARIGPEGQGGVLLSAHSDVVPVEGQGWTYPPFELTKDGTKLFGRGTTDMKGFLASMLALAQRTEKTSLTEPLMLLISYDEEVGCQGIRKMMPEFENLGWSPDLCLVGEPTSMIPATGHKGKAALRATCRGITGHSALAPNYVNALHLAADFVGALRDIQDSYAEGSSQDKAYDIPYSTVHVGKLTGGTALNIVPETAIIEFELRHLPSDDLPTFLKMLDGAKSRILAPFQATGGQVGIEIEVTNTYPGLEIAPDSKTVQRAAGLSGANNLTKVAFGTEAGFFTGIDIGTVVCGPGNMEEQGHKADEFITAEQLGACDAMMDRLLSQISGGLSRV